MYNESEQQISFLFLFESCIYLLKQLFGLNFPFGWQ